MTVDEIKIEIEAFIKKHRFPNKMNNNIIGLKGRDRIIIFNKGLDLSFSYKQKLSSETTKGYVPHSEINSKIKDFSNSKKK
jgi:hypothetical protein